MWWHTYKKDLIFPLKEIEFEGHKFYCPNNTKSYLLSYYGKDYMKLPPEHKRIVHCDMINLFEADNNVDISLKWKEIEKDCKNINKII